MSVFSPNEIQALRARFPILSRTVHGKPLVYLDSAASSQVPESVISAEANFQRTMRANVHRGVHTLSQEATEVHEGLRDRIQKLVGASRREEIVFARGTTEAINLVAWTFGRQKLNPGDVVLAGELEHHANLVPWQIVAPERGALVEKIPALDDGTLDFQAYLSILDSRPVKILALQHVSNALGTVNPIERFVAEARSRGIATLVDAAQSLPHMSVDVAAIGCDFLAFSGHKMCGPTGIGVLYGREEKLDETPPYQGGGEMISSVKYFETKWNVIPHKFEAGTPDISGAIALHTAMDYIDGIGRENIFAHDQALASYAYKRLVELGHVRMFGPPLGGTPEQPHSERGGLVSFLLPEVHAHDVVTMADQYGVALRGGHHCTQPLMRKLGIQSTARGSFYFYNTKEEVDRMVDVLAKIHEFFSRGL